MIAGLNKLKRGVADMELDCDNDILVIQKFNKQTFKPMELSSIAYSIIYLCQHEEYSMREFAQHALDHILGQLNDNEES